MVKLILINKLGEIKEKVIKDKELNINIFFKYAGFRKEEYFKKQHTWKLSKNKYLSLYAKTKGRANTENKYELPPPIDNELFFSSLLIVLTETEEVNEKNIIDLNKQTYEKIYEKLFGGFDDIESEENDVESEDEYNEFDEITKEGYVKDDFIVDDESEEDEEEYDSELEEEEYIDETDDEENEIDEDYYSDEN